MGFTYFMLLTVQLMGLPQIAMAFSAFAIGVFVTWLVFR